MQLVLASNSPRRKQLLAQLTQNFIVIPAKGKEVVEANLSVQDVARSLARQKCEEVFSSHPDCAVLGCDTIVVFEGKVLGKPKTEEEAAQTLAALSGKSHSVITGVCLKVGDSTYLYHDQTEVYFNDLTPEFIRAYVATGSPMDKAGSYGIQDGGVVKSYVGSYTNVVGFPLELIQKIFTEAQVQL